MPFTTAASTMLAFNRKPNKRILSAGIAAVAALACLANASLGQISTKEASPAELEKLKERVDAFFEEFEDPEVGTVQALRGFVRASPLEKRGESLDKLVEQAGRLKDSYGKFSEHEAVTAKSFGKDLVVLRYLLKAEQFPIVWHFYFYRQPKTTMTMLDNGTFTLVEIRFDTDLDSLDR